MQRGNPALLGKGIERRREADQWNYRFVVAGQPYYGPCNTHNKQKAERYSAQLKAEKKVDTRKDRELGLGPMRFGAACDVWWREAAINNVETGLKFRLDWLRTQLGEDRFLKDITPEDITALQIARSNCLRTAGKDASGKQLYRPLTPAAVKATLVTLRTVIGYAARAKGVAVRQFDWTTWIKQDAEDADIRVMTEAEQALIWPELSDDVREVAEFNLETPKRINEILPLTWSNVDFLGETIKIRLKGKRKLFDDPIGPSEVMRLQRLKARKLHPVAVFSYESRRTRAYGDAKHVKGSRRPMTYQHFYENWTAACAKVGITDLHPHCLRHTGATRYYWSNPDKIAVVSKMLNHANIATTVRYYAKHHPDLVRDLKRAFAKTSKTLPAKLPARLLKNR